MLTRHRKRSIGRRRAFRHLVRRKRVGAHEQRVGAASFAGHAHGVGDLRARLCDVVAQHGVRHVHRLEQRLLHGALLLVLRFVFRVRLAAPADQQQHRHAVAGRIADAQQRVNAVAEAAVLHVHARQSIRRNVVTDRQTDRIAFVRRNDVMCRASVVGNVTADVFQQRILTLAKIRAVLRTTMQVVRVRARITGTPVRNCTPFANNAS